MPSERLNERMENAVIGGNAYVGRIKYRKN